MQKYTGSATDNSLFENTEMVEGWYEILLPEPPPSPTITATINPVFNITEMTPITLSANVSDDRFRSIQIIVDNSIVKECKSNTPVRNCSLTEKPGGLYPSIKSVGNHYYFALAYDAFGNHLSSEKITFSVKACPNYYQNNQTCYYTNFTEPICGDALCNSGETSIWCPQDCKVEPNKVNLSAFPLEILKGQNITLSWNATGNAASCMASVGWSGVKTKSGVEVVKPSQTAIYILTCGDKLATTCVTVNATV